MGDKQRKDEEILAVVSAGLHRHNRDMAVRFHLQEQRREVRQEEDGGLLRAANHSDRQIDRRVNKPPSTFEESEETPEFRRPNLRKRKQKKMNIVQSAIFRIHRTTTKMRSLKLRKAIRKRRKTHPTSSAASSAGSMEKCCAATPVPRCTTANA